MPFLRSHSSALAKSPSVSARAFLQSIIPAPVFSRRSFTIAAVISAIVHSPSASWAWALRDVARVCPTCLVSLLWNGRREGSSQGRAGFSYSAA